MSYIVRGQWLMLKKVTSLPLTRGFFLEDCVAICASICFWYYQQFLRVGNRSTNYMNSNAKIVWCFHVCVVPFSSPLYCFGTMLTNTTKMLITTNVSFLTYCKEMLSKKVTSLTLLRGQEINLRWNLSLALSWYCFNVLINSCSKFAIDPHL